VNIRGGVEEGQGEKRQEDRIPKANFLIKKTKWPQACNSTKQKYCFFRRFYLGFRPMVVGGGTDGSPKKIDSNRA
jgi:hypothetical protein